MNLSTGGNILIGLAVIVWLCSRQLRWRVIDPARIWRLPLVLGAAGVLSLARQHVTLHPADIAILGASGVVALISGTVMGRLARFRPAQQQPGLSSPQQPGLSSPQQHGLFESRTGWAGVAVWFALVVVRIGIDVAGHRLGSDLAVSTGSILLMLALNRIASALVVTARRPRRALATAGR